MRHRFLLPVFLGCAGISGCSGGSPAVAQQPDHARSASTAPVCEVAGSAIVLPNEVRETSGLARSARDASLFWTHNDAGNKPELFAIGRDGRLIQRVRVAGATLVDWEDIEAARCGGAHCLYVGDIGDNDGVRETITIYRVEEPAAGAFETKPAVALHARFPEGARDAEALFADATGNLYVVTKGREGAVVLYRYPAPGRPGEVVTLEKVREVFPQPTNEIDRVTSATSTPDGAWVAIRTYRQLHLYRAAALLTGAPTQPITADLSVLGETQGESIVLSDDGLAWTSSEAENKRAQPRLSGLRCSLPAN